MSASATPAPKTADNKRAGAVHVLHALDTVPRKLRLADHIASGHAQLDAVESAT
ncbi:MAG: hypothetical protein ACRDSZ_00195 [Pseudonocardiaceae bacterium]